MVRADAGASPIAHCATVTDANSPDLAEFKSNQTLSEDNFESIITVVHGALTRAYPALTRDEFLDLPISTSELIGALPPIIRQAGYFNLAVEASSDA